MSLIIKQSNNLSGHIEISGAKNALLPLIASTILTKKEVTFYNVPQITDIDIMCNILKSMGSRITRNGSILVINNENINPTKISFDEMRKIRGSCLILGPLLSRFNYGEIVFPGGCNIGKRPIDIHLDGFRQLGATVDVNGENIKCVGKLKPTTINLRLKSVGATENLIMASVLVKGETKLINCAKEPEIIDLCKFLNTIGAKITGHGSDEIRIRGVNFLYGTTYTPMPDRIEAGTYMLLASGVKSDVEFRNVNPYHLKTVNRAIRQMGVSVNCYHDIIRIRSTGDIGPINIACNTYPAFPTDLQAPIVTLLCKAKGQSKIAEKIFENRFAYTNELIKMGADITLKGNVAIVNGTDNLCGTKVNATDLRGGGALVMAGVYAKGQTEIENTHYISRGYGQIVDKLKNIGVDIKEENNS